MSTKPVTSVPATAPRVFHVSNRPTPRPNSGPLCGSSRIHNGNTAPSKPAGMPSTTSDIAAAKI